MTPAQQRRLDGYRTQLRQLHEELAAQPSGFISSGSVIRRYLTCGSRGCHCRADPPVLHGPYWQLNQVVGGRKRTRFLSEAQAALFQEWIASRRHLTEILGKMELVSQKAAEILLQEPGQRRAAPTLAGRPSELRMSRHLVEALETVSEQVGDVAEAAREWLEASEAEDREAMSEAKKEFIQSLQDSELPRAVTHLAPLARISRRPRADAGSTL